MLKTAKNTRSRAGAAIVRRQTGPPENEGKFLFSRQFVFYRVLPTALLLATVTVLIWSPCLKFGFVFDDHGQIESNPRIQALTYVGPLVTEPLWEQLGSRRASHYYRPVFSLLLIVQYRLFGANPTLWHGTSLALHGFAVLTIYALLVLLFGRVFPAFVGGLFFAVSPVHAEVISWVSAADESLCGIFVMLALCALILANRTATANVRTRWMVISGLLFAMSLFTKETAVGAGLILISYALIANRGKKRDIYRVLMIYVIPLAVYSIARLWALHGSMFAHRARTLSSVLSVFPTLVFFSVRQLIWPGAISLFYDTPIIKSYRPDAAVVVGIVVLAGVIWLFRKAPILSWAITLFVFPLLPWAFALLYLSEYALFQNRYLYFPSLALSVLIAFVFSKVGLRSWIGLATIMACLLLCLHSLLEDHDAAIPYHDDVALFTRSVEVAPHNVMAIHLLGDAKERSGDDLGAQNLFLKAVQLRPDLWDTNFDLAMACLKRSNKENAGESLLRSLRSPYATTSQRALSWFELGRIKAAQDDLSGAAESFYEAEKLEPSSKRVHVELARIFLSEGRFKEAEMERIKSRLPSEPDRAK